MTGRLYQIQRASDGTTVNIGLLSAGGDVNAAPQVSFCAGTTCTITKIYDQSSNHSDLPISSGGYWKGPGPNGSDIGANAMALPVTIAGHQAFGVRITPGTGYRVDNVNVPTGSQPEGIYMITSSNLYNNQCCMDFGSGETSHDDTGNGHMNAIYFGSACWFGGCTGPGPWVEADLENGMYSTNTGPNTASNPGRELPVRQRLGEEQRHQQLHPQVRQRDQRRADHHLLGFAAERLLPDARGGRHPARHRRGQQQR